MRTSFALIFFLLTLRVASAGPELAPLSAGGLNYCPPPHRPTCADTDETFGRQTALDACTSEFQRYVETVVTYRLCLTREIGRAVMEINTATALFKCKTSGKPKCK